MTMFLSLLIRNFKVASSRTFSVKKFSISTKFPIQNRKLTSANPIVVNELVDGILKCDRSSIARSITLVESRKLEHKKLASELLFELRNRQLNNLEKLESTFRIGISGPPGVGKSTFIEALGTHLTRHSYKVAVLAIDPSSVRSGGSILGDKTRMEELSKDPNAYVRPSPTRGSLGGVARSTNDAIEICEAAGFDIILVETVGVGQSEVAVAHMTDMFTLLMPPAGGDELQGIKKGIMEWADLIIMNKADGDLIPIAKRSAAEYRGALGFLVQKSSDWKPKVMICSSVEKKNIPEIWDTMKEFNKIKQNSGEKSYNRGQQRLKWVWKLIEEDLVTKFQLHPQVKPLLEGLQKKVENREVTPGVAADQLTSIFFNEK